MRPLHRKTLFGHKKANNTRNDRKQKRLSAKQTNRQAARQFFLLQSHDFIKGSTASLSLLSVSLRLSHARTLSFHLSFCSSIVHFDAYANTKRAIWQSIRDRDAYKVNAKAFCNARQLHPGLPSDTRLLIQRATIGEENFVCKTNRQASSQFSWQQLFHQGPDNRILSSPTMYITCRSTVLSYTESTVHCKSPSYGCGGRRNQSPLLRIRRYRIIILSFKPGVGQNTALRVPPAARYCTFLVFVCNLVSFNFIFPNPLPT